MKVNFKLVGFVNQEKKNSINEHVIINDFEELSLKNIFKYFNKIKLKDDTIVEFDDSELDKVKFIIASEEAKDKEKVYPNNVNSEHNVFLICNKEEIKSKLMKIFIDLGVDITEVKNNVMKKELEEMEKENEEDHVLKKEELDELNNDLIELFKDEDFNKLLYIYNNKIDLFDKLYQFVDCGNIIDEIEKKDISDFNYNNEFNKLKEILSNLNEDIDDETLRNIIYNFNGNLNLSMRFVLNKS